MTAEWETPVADRSEMCQVTILSVGGIVSLDTSVGKTPGEARSFYQGDLRGYPPVNRV